MRKLATIILVLSFFYVTAQDSTKFKNGYISPGVGISGGVYTYSVEVGMWNQSVWISGVAEFTPANNRTVVYTGPKFYKHISSYGGFVDAFLYGAVKLGVTENYTPIVFEPGCALVFNVKNIGFQISFSTPISEGTNVWSPILFSTGFGINYNL